MIRLLASAALAAAVVASAACATASKSDTGEAAAALSKFDKTGKTQSCLPLRTVSNIRPLSDKQFLVRVGINQYYLNNTKGRCSNAASTFNRLQYTTSTGSLCANEIIRVVDNQSGMIEGACSLGDFQELKKKPSKQ